MEINLTQEQIEALQKYKQSKFFPDISDEEICLKIISYQIQPFMKQIDNRILNSAFNKLDENEKASVLEILKI